MAKHPFLPPLFGAHRGQRSIPYDLSHGPQPGDVIRFEAALGDAQPGDEREVVGYCLSREAPGEPAYALRLYLTPGPTDAVPYADRSAARFEAGQHEETWFAGIHLAFTELDLTDHADEVRLVRQPAAEPAIEPTTEPDAAPVVRPLYPSSSPTIRRQAA